jgi:hypothetical protein
VEYAITRSIQVLATRPFPTAAGIQTVLDEPGKETKLKSSKLEDFVDLRALRKLEKDGFSSKGAATMTMTQARLAPSC